MKKKKEKIADVQVYVLMAYRFGFYDALGQIKNKNGKHGELYNKLLPRSYRVELWFPELFPRTNIFHKKIEDLKRQK